MLEQRSATRDPDTTPPEPQTGLDTFIIALAVGLVVALAVLMAFTLHLQLGDDTPTKPAAAPTAPGARPGTGTAASPGTGVDPGTGTGPGTQPGTGPGTGAGPGTDGGQPNAQAPQNATSPKPTPGLPAQAGQPVKGVQLAAAAPFSDIHQDQGSTIALPDGRTLWIFADTFQLYNEPRFFITSSAALSGRNPFQLTYSMTNALPTEFLPRTKVERDDHKVGDHYQAIWPTGSTLLPDGRIIISYAKYLVLLKQKDFKLMESGLFEFRYRGVNALVNGGRATRFAPGLWKAEDGEVRSPVYVDGHVYFNQCRDLRCVALRVTPDQLGQRGSYRWWTGSGWTSERSQAQNIIVGSSHPGGNASVVRLRSGRYAMADTEVGAVATSGLLWVSPNPWGPWSPAAKFDFPRCPEPGCYGLNIHPSQSSDDQLRISYATNGVGPFVRVADVPVWISSDSSAILVR